MTDLPTGGGKVWAIASMLVILSLLFGGCTTAAEGSPNSQGFKVEEDSCPVSAMDECFKIATGQWVSVAKAAKGSDFILLDAGGPGAAATNTASIEGSLPNWMRAYAIVKIYEPWVGRSLFSGCNEYFAEISWSNPARQNSPRCNEFISEWYQPPLEDAVAEVSRKLGGNLAGIVTFSFGSTRTRDIWPLLGTSGFLLAVQPAPDSRIRMPALLQARAGGAWEALRNSHDQACRSRSCFSLDEVRQKLNSTEVQSGWGVTGVEMSLFITGAVGDRSKYGELLAKIFTRETYIKSELSTIRRVAMGVSHSLEPNFALSSNVGYRAAMCQAYGPALTESLSDPIEAAFTAQVGTCPAEIAGYTSLPAAPSRSCLLISRSDPVIPPSLLNTRDAFVAQSMVTYLSTDHIWPADVVSDLGKSDSCLTRLKR